MLCDLMLGEWADEDKAPKFEPEVEEAIELVKAGASVKDLDWLKITCTFRGNVYVMPPG
jgi:hypothetical protein